MEKQRVQNVPKTLGFTCLPDHIWEKIIGHSKNIKNVMLTCKYFNDLVSKSHQLMDRMTLVLDEIESDERTKVADILKSERKIICVQFKDLGDFDFMFGFILGHFRNSVRKVTFDRKCRPNILMDLIDLLPNLEELDIWAVDFRDSPSSVEFSEGRKLKKVRVRDARVLQYMPEIEDLSCHIFSANSSRVLKEYLESHNQLQKLKVLLEKSESFPSISSESIHLELNTFALVDYFSRDLRLNSHAIAFVQSHAKSLKHLVIGDLTYNWDEIQVIKIVLFLSSH
jgi:hypothetical protein